MTLFKLKPYRCQQIFKDIHVNIDNDSWWFSLEMIGDIEPLTNILPYFKYKGPQLKVFINYYTVKGELKKHSFFQTNSIGWMENPCSAYVRNLTGNEIVVLNNRVAENIANEAKNTILRRQTLNFTIVRICLYIPNQKFFIENLVPLPFTATLKKVFIGAGLTGNKLIEPCYVKEISYGASLGIDYDPFTSESMRSSSPRYIETTLEGCHWPNSERVVRSNHPRDLLRLPTKNILPKSFLECLGIDTRYQKLKIDQHDRV